jgi:hypothetical protein
MTDALGRSIPVEYVEKFDIERDKVARRVLARYQKAEAYLLRVKAETLADIAALRADGKTGNFQFMSFDALIRVRLDARTAIEFDHRFQEAQDLIFEYLDEITKETGRADIASIVQAAFKPSSGSLLSRAKVMSLTRIDIKHEKWTQAMDLLKQSQFAKMGKTYVYCETRSTPGGDFNTILLDFAAIDPAADERDGTAHDAPQRAASTPPEC